MCSSFNCTISFYQYHSFFLISNYLSICDFFLCKYLGLRWYYLGISLSMMCHLDMSVFQHHAYTHLRNHQHRLTHLREFMHLYHFLILLSIILYNYAFLFYFLFINITHFLKLNHSSIIHNKNSLPN